MKAELISFCRGRKLFCYGAGEYGRVTKLYLQYLGIDIEGFVVSGGVKGANVLSTPVYSFDSFPFDYAKCAFLITLSESLHSIIIERLIGVGCKEIHTITATDVAVMRNEIDTSKLVIDRSGILVLLYHRVAMIEKDMWSLATPPELFEKQMRFLKDNYTITHIGSNPETAKDGTVIVTFDDGYVDNYTNAFPVLEENEIPATFYICTGNIGTNKEFWWDELEGVLDAAGETEPELFRKHHEKFKAMKPHERQRALSIIRESSGRTTMPRAKNRSLNEKELRILDGSGLIQIGAHTVTHSCMANLSRKEAEFEATESKRALESVLEHEIVHFSYPFGNASDKGPCSEEVLERAGYKTVATTAGGVMRKKNGNMFSIPRNSVLPTIKSVFDFERFLDITFAISDGVII